MGLNFGAGWWDNLIGFICITVIVIVMFGVTAVCVGLFLRIVLNVAGY